jgi:Restriction endonuclease
MATDGAQFENRVYRCLRRALENGSLGLSPKASLVRLNPKYLSFEREKLITIDVAIEVTLAGDRCPSLIWVWECKDTGRPVGVASVEEFHAKLEQIGLHSCKGTMISTSGFRSSALAYADRKGIGLANYNAAEGIKDIERLENVTTHHSANPVPIPHDLPWWLLLAGGSIIGLVIFARRRAHALQVMPPYSYNPRRNDDVFGRQFVAQRDSKEERIRDGVFEIWKSTLVCRLLGPLDDVDRLADLCEDFFYQDERASSRFLRMSNACRPRREWLMALHRPLKRVWL